MALPVAAIICIVLACWVVVVLVIFALYQLLKTRGSCSCECAPCGKEGEGGCSECCISLSESCNCCNPSVNGCLDSICPGKKRVNCVDIVLCQCCANEGEESCCVKESCSCDPTPCSLCDGPPDDAEDCQCPDCRCPDCDCRCPDWCRDYECGCPDCDCSCPCEFVCPVSVNCDTCCGEEEEETSGCCVGDCCSCACCGFCCDEPENDREPCCNCGPENNNACQCCTWCDSWECALRPCDPCMCDCCPKILCDRTKCLGNRQYPYCLDYCDLCSDCVYCCKGTDGACLEPTYMKYKRCCYKLCSDPIESRFEFHCCCEYKRPCPCDGKWDAFKQSFGDPEPITEENYIEKTIEYRLQNIHHPHCCIKVSWLCFEIRRKKAPTKDKLAVLARDISHLGFSMQFLNDSGNIVDPRVVEEAITSQPESSLGYTDSYGGYVSFADYHGPRSQTGLNRHHSSSTIGHRRSHHHNGPVRLAQSMPDNQSTGRQRNSHGRNLARHQHTEENETILYNETLGATDSDIHPRHSVRRNLYFSDSSASEDESEIENATKLKHFRVRESETMIKIHSNQEQFEAIDSRLRQFEEHPLDTSGLDLYYKKLSESLSRTTDSYTTGRRVSFADEVLPPGRQKQQQKTLKDSDSHQQTSFRYPERGRYKTRKNKVAAAVEKKQTVQRDPVPGPSGLRRVGEPSTVKERHETTSSAGKHVRRISSAGKRAKETVKFAKVDLEDEQEESVYVQTRRRKKRKSGLEAKDSTVIVPNFSASRGNTKLTDTSKKDVSVKNDETDEHTVTDRLHDKNEDQEGGHRKKHRKIKTDHEAQKRPGKKRKKKASDPPVPRTLPAGVVHRPLPLPPIGRRPGRDGSTDRERQGNACNQTV